MRSVDGLFMEKLSYHLKKREVDLDGVDRLLQACLFRGWPELRQLASKNESSHQPKLRTNPVGHRTAQTDSFDHLLVTAASKYLPLNKI
jgi:hypothetical protein